VGPAHAQGLFGLVCEPTVRVHGSLRELLGAM